MQCAKQPAKRTDLYRSINHSKLMQDRTYGLFEWFIYLILSHGDILLILYSDLICPTCVHYSKVSLLPYFYDPCVKPHRCVLPPVRKHCDSFPYDGLEKRLSSQHCSATRTRKAFCHVCSNLLRILEEEAVLYSRKPMIIMHHPIL